MKKRYNRNLPLGRRMDQFRILFDLGMGYKKDVVEKMQRDHLRALVEAKRALRNASKKGKRHARSGAGVPGSMIPNRLNLRNLRLKKKAASNFYPIGERDQSWH